MFYYCRGMREIARELEELGPDGGLFDLLAGLEWDVLSQDQLVTARILARKIKTFGDWAELCAVKRIHDTTELAMAITEPEQTVARRKETSDVLDLLPRLADQLRHGDLDLRRVDAVRQRVRHLPNRR